MSPALASRSISENSYFASIFFEVKTVHVVAAVAGIALLSFIYRLYVYPFFISPLRHVPGPPMGHPIWGQAKQMINSGITMPERTWAQEHGPVFRMMNAFGLETLCFMSEGPLHSILVDRWLDYPRPEYLRNILGNITGYGLLTVTGSEHRQMRKAMNPAFALPNLMAQTDMYYDAIQGLVDIFASQIDSKEGKDIQVYDWMSKVTLDIICETAFGYHTDSLHDPHNELAVAYEDLLSIQSGPNLAMLIVSVSLPGVPKLLRSQFAHRHRAFFSKFRLFAPLSTVIDAMHRIKRISHQMLQEKMWESLDSGVVEGDSELSGKKDIMSIMVRARIRDAGNGYRMSDEAMMDQVLTFLGAGHETTASGLTWTLWLLANDLLSQDRLRKEVRPVVASNPRPDYKTLRDLKWLDCVVMESLRVMPPAPVTVRKAAKTDYLNGILIPKGTLIDIPIRAINTSTDTWGPDAEEFKPERWLNLPKAYNPTFSSFSFIAGPHACIGKTMAIIEMKAVLAALIARFAFEPTHEGQKANPAAAITMKPTDGMPLKVKRL